MMMFPCASNLNYKSMFACIYQINYQGRRDLLFSCLRLSWIMVMTTWTSLFTGCILCDSSTTAETRAPTFAIEPKEPDPNPKPWQNVGDSIELIRRITWLTALHKSPVVMSIIRSQFTGRKLLSPN